MTALEVARTWNASARRKEDEEERTARRSLTPLEVAKNYTAPVRRPAVSAPAASADRSPVRSNGYVPTSPILRDTTAPAVPVRSNGYVPTAPVLRHSTAAATQGSVPGTAAHPISGPVEARRASIPHVNFPEANFPAVNFPAAQALNTTPRLQIYTPPADLTERIQDYTSERAEAGRTPQSSAPGAAVATRGNVPGTAAATRSGSSAEDAQPFSALTEVQGIFAKGMVRSAQSLWSGINFLEKVLMDPFLPYYSEGSLSAIFAEQDKQALADMEEEYAANTAKGGKAAEIVDRYGTAAVQAIPNLLFAWITAGASASAEGTAALVAASEAAANSSLLSTSVTALSSMAKDPKYWFSFLNTVGTSYEQAKADGAEEGKARLYALSNAAVNAAIEIGGGIEELPRELRSGGKPLLSWIGGMVDEGKEEVAQGFMERLLQNVVYQRGNDLVSLDRENQDAVLNPWTAAEEFTGGAVVGGVLGGAQIGLAASADALTRRLSQAGQVQAQRRAAEARAELEAQIGRVDTDTRGNPITSYAEAARLFRERVPDATEEQVQAFYRQYRDDSRTVLFGGQRLTRQEFRSFLQETMPGLEITDAEADRLFDQQVIDGLDGSDALERIMLMRNDGSATLTDRLESAEETALPKGTGAAERGFLGETSAKLNEQADVYGEIDRGENPAYGRYIRYPQSTDGKDRVALTARTVAEASATPDERLPTIGGMVAEGRLSHIPISDASAKAHAEATLLSQGWSRTLSAWIRDVLDGKAGKDLVALGATLLNNAGNHPECTPEEYAQLLTDYASLLTRSGQSVQAARLLKQLTPEGALYSVQREVDKANDGLRKRMKSRDRTAMDRAAGAMEEGRKEAAGRIKEQFDAQARAADAETDSGHGDNAPSSSSGTAPGGSKKRERKRDHGVPAADWMREVGNRLAEAIRRRMERQQTQPSPITKTIQRDLLRFAEQYYLPERKIQRRRTAAERIQDALNNAENYARAWNQAKAALRQQYANDPQMLSALEDYLGGTIGYAGSGTDAVMMQAILEGALDEDERTQDLLKRILSNVGLGNREQLETVMLHSLRERIRLDNPEEYETVLRPAVSRYVQEAVERSGGTEQQVRKEVQATLQRIGVSIGEAIDFGAADRAELTKRIAEVLVQQYQIPEDAARATGEIVSKTFGDMAREAAMERLEQLALERPTRSQARAQQRLRELVQGMAEDGAFYSNRYDRLNRGDLGTYITIDPELVRQYRSASTDVERDRVMDRIVQNVADQVPSTWLDKWNALRFTSMLGNLRTQTRNLLSNLAFQPVVGIKNGLAAGLESAAVKAGLMEDVERTRSLGYRQSDFQKARKDFEDFRDIVLSGGQTQAPDITFAGRVRDARGIFGTNRSDLLSRTVGKALEAWRTKTNWVMDMGDAIFCRYTYAVTLARYLQAHGVIFDTATEEQLDRARSMAIKEAAEATFRDNNALSEMILGVGFKETGGNFFKQAANVAVQGVLPFRKTPANVLARAFEYSPLGLFQAAYQAESKAHGADLQGSDIVNRLAKGLTGTGLFAVGYALSQAGILRGFGSEDEERRDFEEMQGHQRYSLEIGDQSYTLDWMSPTVVPMLTAANLYAAMADGAVSREDVFHILSGISDPIMEMSFLSGVQDLFDNISSLYDSDSSAMTTLVTRAVESYFTQAVPTVGGHAEKAGSRTRTTTYTDSDSWLGQDAQYQLAQIFNRVPGIDLWQIDYIDAWGRTQSNFETNWSDTVDSILNGVNSMVGPGYQRQIKTSPMEEELERLYTVTGDADVLPQRPAQTQTIEGYRRRLTGEEYVAFAQARGQSAYRSLTQLTGSSGYKALTDEGKAEAVRSAFREADATAKALLRGSFAADSAKAKVAEAAVGLDTERYAEIAEEMSAVTGLSRDGQTVPGSYSVAAALAIERMQGLTEDQRRWLKQQFRVGKTYLDKSVKELKSDWDKMLAKASSK